MLLLKNTQANVYLFSILVCILVIKLFYFDELLYTYRNTAAIQYIQTYIFISRLA